MTRVVARLEAMDGYVPGETPVAIFGGDNPDKERLQAGSLSVLAGLWYDSQATYLASLENYVRIVLQYDVNFVSGAEQRLRETDAYQQMGCFPAKDSIAFIDGIVVVRMDKTS